MHPLPYSGAKMLSGCNGRLNSRILRIHRRGHNSISPPTRRFNIAQREREEDEQCA